jgi:RNA polymerase sigma-70 factor, ECF subfamily
MDSLSSIMELSAQVSESAEQETPVISQAEYDIGLVRRFNGGDAAAFVEIATRYRGKMLAVALSFLRNHADAEEIAQDTLIRAHRALRLFRGDSSLATWLHCIAFNLSRNRYWYYHRRHRHNTRSFDSTFSDENNGTLADFVASPAPDPARQAATEDFLTQVETCMEKLSAEHREILTLRNSLDRSYSEIAETLGIGLGTVKSRIGRARITLRRHLDETYVGSGANSVALPWFEATRPSGRIVSAGR